MVRLVTPVPTQEHPKLRHRRQSRHCGDRAVFDGELSQGSWLARRVRIQPGEANFAALQAWNAAPVYEQAIAVIGRQIDGGEGLGGALKGYSGAR